MELHKINGLLEKYFEAETSTAEENELRSYFASGDVAPELEQYGPMFGYFGMAKEETSVKSIAPVQTKRPILWVSIAASVLVLVSIGLTFFNQQQPDDLGTFDDPEVAYRETQKALQMLSGNVNKGIESVGYVEQYQSATEKVFNE